MLINAMSWVYLFISCKGASSTTVMNESRLHKQDKAFLVFVLLTPEVVQGTVWVHKWTIAASGHSTREFFEHKSVNGWLSVEWEET